MRQPRGIASRRVVLDDGVAAATVRFAGERIAAIVPGVATDPGILDVGDLVVSPGLVDSHVHMNEPGRADWEGFETATRAAAAGGVTTVVDMPLNSSPVTTTLEALAAKLAAAEGKRYVDVGFWAGVVPGNARELGTLAEAGVLGGKAFMVHSGIDEFPAVVEGDLRAAMAVLRDHGLPLLAHAEIDLGAPAGDDPRSYEAYVASRPPAWEDAAIRLLIDLCRETGCAVHVVHLASASAIEPIRAARAAGLPLTVETCPHYLAIDAGTIPDGATQFKCAPPIRDRATRDRLWQALFDGTIDAVVTDHSPCPPGMKQFVSGDFRAAWGGLASLQHALPIVWTEASGRGAGLAQLARWMSAGPARIAGLENSKGRIAPGLDADLVVWDPEAVVTIDAASLRYRHQVSPYIGWTPRGRVHRTILRGREIFDGIGYPAGPVGRDLLYRSEAA